jgi:hypothetical protein
VRFVIHKVAKGAVFLRVLLFSPVSITQPMLHTNLNLHVGLVVVVVVVFLGFRDKPRMYYSLAGLLYRSIWTFQIRPLDDSAPADVSRTPRLPTRPAP